MTALLHFAGSLLWQCCSWNPAKQEIWARQNRERKGKREKGGKWKGRNGLCHHPLVTNNQCHCSVTVCQSCAHKYLLHLIAWCRRCYTINNVPIVSTQHSARNKNSLSIHRPLLFCLCVSVVASFTLAASVACISCFTCVEYVRSGLLALCALRWMKATRLREWLHMRQNLAYDKNRAELRIQCTTSGVPCDGAAKPELIDSSTVRRSVADSECWNRGQKCRGWGLGSGLCPLPRNFCLIFFNNAFLRENFT